MLDARPKAAVTVISGVSRHKADAEVSEAACGAARNLAAAGWRAALVENGAVEAMVEALSTHEETPAVLQNAISALIALTSGGDANIVRGKMRRLGCVMLIKAALQSHPGHEGLEGVGLYMLRELGVKF